MTLSEYSDAFDLNPDSISTFMRIFIILCPIKKSRRL
jgi:hypothetical protein